MNPVAVNLLTGFRRGQNYPCCAIFLMNNTATRLPIENEFGEVPLMIN